MQAASTHSPTDIQAAFERVGRQITQPRAAKVTARIVEFGFEDAIARAYRAFDGADYETALDLRAYVQCRMDANWPKADLIALLEHEAEFLRRPYPYPSTARTVALADLETRIARLGGSGVSKREAA